MPPVTPNFFQAQRLFSEAEDNDFTTVNAQAEQHLVGETPSELSRRVHEQLQTEERSLEMQEPRFELRSDLNDSRISSNKSDDTFLAGLMAGVDPNRLTFGNNAGAAGAAGAPEKEMIKRASRTAQILLQDKGIKMTRPLRKKIISYQSDMGY